jgi:hypothetical protein
MRALVSVWLLFGLASIPAAFAQGPETGSTGAHSQPTQQRGAVQVGAGSKGDVTTGASGPDSSGVGPLPQPAAVTIRLKPPSDPFYGPGQLPIERPRQLRCEMIGDPRARRSCENKMAKEEGRR